jgi:hypothetical protein
MLDAISVTDRLRTLIYKIDDIDVDVSPNLLNESRTCPIPLSIVEAGTCPSITYDQEDPKVGKSKSSLRHALRVFALAQQKIGALRHEIHKLERDIREIARTISDGLSRQMYRLKFPWRSNRERLNETFLT